MTAANDQGIDTIEALLALPDDGMRHELLDGEHVVTPAPRPQHQAALRELMVTMTLALEDRPDLVVYHSPADVVLEPKTLVQPDLFVVAKEPERLIRSWDEVGTPILAIEILSPTTALRDRGIKRTIYQRAGIGEYWIVDLDARLVERWMPTDDRPQICQGVLEWVPPNGSPIRVNLATLFNKVLL